MANKIHTHDPKIMAQLVMKLMDARTTGHVLHLATRSFSVHMALNDFYNGIGESADKIAEAYQGTAGVLLDMPATEGRDKDPLLFLHRLQSWIDANRDEACSDSEIQNLIDEAMELIDSTLYKLRFLK